MNPSIPASFPDGVWAAAEKGTSMVSSIKAARALASFMIQNLAENSLPANEVRRRAGSSRGELSRNRMIVSMDFARSAFGGRFVLASLLNRCGMLCQSQQDG